MKAFATVIILIAAHGARAETADHSMPFVGGEGATLCAKWLSERSDPGSVLFFGLEAWVSGFVSGAFMVQAPKPLTAIEQNDVIERVGRYCVAHPTDRVVQAAANVSADLFQLEAKQIRGQLKH
jgi:hypothetical protein